jgi:hypothetical protein
MNPARRINLSATKQTETVSVSLRVELCAFDSYRIKK